MSIFAVGAPVTPLHSLAVVGHLIGLGLGIGGATVTDATFVECVRKRRANATLNTVMEVSTRCVTAGLALLILSGVALMLTGSHPSSRFWAKMIVVGIVTLNGTVAHRLTFPRLAAVLRRGSGDISVSFLNQLSVAAAVSAVSWYGALILGAWKTATLPLAGYLAIYLFALSWAVAVSLVLTPKLLGADQSTAVAIRDPLDEELDSIRAGAMAASTQLTR